MGLNADLAGKDFGTKTYEVTAEAIENYARATNDLNERYLSTDVVASPVFPIVPAFDSFMAAAMDPELGADLLRLVHGAEEHVLYEPIRPGDTLTVSTILESVDKKDSGETFTVKSTETNQHGTPVAEVRGTMFIRGSGRGERPSTARSDESERAIAHEASVKVDEDQTQRYAEASGDRNPIHLDEATAKMAGLPGADPARHVHDGDGHPGSRGWAGRRRPNPGRARGRAFLEARSAGAGADDEVLARGRFG